jgi:predicted acetyltransferase
MEKLSLITPSIAFEDEYRALVAETYAIDGLFMRQVEEDFAAFVSRLTRESHGVGLQDGHVAQSTYWLVRDGVRLLGASRLRHYLNPALEEWGGHIGYNVRPCEWHKGYGTQLLTLTIAQARSLGLSRVLLMCFEDNIASKRIIEKNGGLLTSTGIEQETGKPYLRYVIDL